MSSTVQAKRRNVFFSFHYADLMRVNVVRLSGQFKTSAASGGRSVEGFYDRSLWESAKSVGPENIKRLIRDGLDRTSAVCVLAGTETHLRPWVRYEIARSVIDGRGLVTVHVNGIRDIDPPHATKPRGVNPAASIGVCRKDDGRLYLCERDEAKSTWTWYDEYTREVELPVYLSEPLGTQVVPLSRGTREYDWVDQDGHANVGGWIDLAAMDVGR